MPSSPRILQRQNESKCESSVFMNVFSPLISEGGDKAGGGEMTFQHQLLAELGQEPRLVTSPWFSSITPEHLGH